MTLHMVTCPLCCQPGFNTSDALCSALVSSSTRKLFCPVCNEVLVGLDKLTIHLFGHKTIKDLSGATDNQNSSYQNKLLVTHSKDVENAVVAPVLYLQSEHGQLFAVSPGSLVNQFGTVTINTQNYISRTNVCDSEIVDSRVSSSARKHSVDTVEFSSCKDLLTSGDFSEPLDGTDVAEPICSTDISEELPHYETESNFQTEERETHPKSVPEAGIVTDAVETESPNPLIPCDTCEMGFSNKAILAVHKQLMHRSGELQGKSENGCQQGSEKSKKKPLSCSWCPSTFNLKSSLMIHIKVTHPAQKETCERKEAEKVTCPVCEKPFPRESALNQHMKAIHGEKPWQCTVCSKSFTTKYFLRKHKRIHTGETPYECAICHKVFTFQQSYHKHMLYHTDDKPYCCSHCGRLFKELSTLNNHERIHSGEKPFACETCGKCFRQRVSYLVHRRIHTGAMPYKCTACNKSFRYKISQRTHKCPEHPPGIVVKTHTTLVDRLQAVIQQGDSGREGHAKLFIESVSHTTQSEFGGLMSPSTSSLQPAFPAVRREAQHEGNHINSANENAIAGNSNSAHGPVASDTSSSSQTPSSHPPLNGLARTSPGDNTAQTSPCIFDCEVAAKSSSQLADEADVFSMNMDSSPSECLGKLHISSGEYYDQQSSSQHTNKSQVVLHPDLSFDNMEDVDLCNLLFDVP